MVSNKHVWVDTLEIMAVLELTLPVNSVNALLHLDYLNIKGCQLQNHLSDSQQNGSIDIIYFGRTSQVDVQLQTLGDRRFASIYQNNFRPFSYPLFIYII